MVVCAALTGGEHNPRSTRPTHPFIQGQTRIDIVRLSVECAREDATVFHGLTRALTKVRQHRMRGIAEDRDATAGPSRQRISVVQRPAVMLL